MRLFTRPSRLGTRVATGSRPYRNRAFRTSGSSGNKDNQRRLSLPREASSGFGAGCGCFAFSFDEEPGVGDEEVHHGGGWRRAGGTLVWIWSSSQGGLRMVAIKGTSHWREKVGRAHRGVIGDAFSHRSRTIPQRRIRGRSSDNEQPRQRPSMMECACISLLQFSLPLRFRLEVARCR